MAGKRILADAATAASRHLVLTDRNIRHRLAVSRAGLVGKLVCAMVPDERLALRTAALLELRRGSIGGARLIGSAGLRPSQFQRHRLTILLRIADCLLEHSAKTPTLREIARTVYPWLESGRSIEWKSAAERRQTQRLVKEARYMVELGYRRLLRGDARSLEAAD